MFVGVDDELKTRYPSEIMVTTSTDKIMDCKEISDGVKETIKKSGRTVLADDSYFGLEAICSGIRFLYDVRRKPCDKVIKFLSIKLTHLHIYCIYFI